jgi:CheY-like chemotaxis protein
MKCNHNCSNNEKENKKLLSIAPEPSVNVSFDVAGFSKVLVVDDNTANLFILSMMLNKLQTKCDQAHNGMEAVNMFASMSYKLVLMDINMPVMNGYEASKRIKQYSQSKNFNVTIVAVSAQDEPNESSLISSNGIDLWVIKPISLSKLKEILQTHQII